MSYYSVSGIHIRHKVKVVVDLSNCASKKELEHAAGIDMPPLSAKKYFITLKAEVDKLGIAKLVNVPTSLNNLNAKVDDLDVGEFKIVKKKC